MMVGPSGRLFAHPSDSLDYFDVRYFDCSMKNRFMVSNAISESTQSIESRMNIFSRLSPARQKRFVQASAPNRAVVLRPQEADPK